MKRFAESVCAEDQKLTVAESIAAHLAEEIDAGRLAEGDQLPSRAVLSRMFKTSEATVSVAFRSLAEKYRLEFVAGKGVFVCGGRITRDTLKIGLVGPYASHVARQGSSASNVYWGPILQHTVLTASARGHAVIAIPDTGRDLSVEDLLAYEVDCVIGHGNVMTASVFRGLQERGIPVILESRGDGTLIGMGASHVDYDGARAFRESVRLFHARGHRRIACFFYQPADRTGDTWRDAFYLELARCGLYYPYEEYCRILCGAVRYGEAEARFREAALAMLDKPDPPTAFLFYTGHELLGPTLEAAAARGLNVGPDFSYLCVAVGGAMPPQGVSCWVQRPEVIGPELVLAAEQLVKTPQQALHVDVPLVLADGGSVFDRNPGEERRKP